MKKRIVAEIGERKFSVQMDSSMNTSVTDQETIIVRYVKEEEVKERLFADCKFPQMLACLNFSGRA